MITLVRTLNESKTKAEYKKALWMYDYWGRLTEKKAAKMVIKLADIKNGCNLLDIACGTGEMLIDAIKLNPDGQNVGVDLSPDMLSIARKKLKKLNLGNFELLEGNALDLHFPDNSFDILLNNYMVDLLPVETFGQIASEFNKVLKPDGVIVMSTFSFGTKRVHKFWYWVAKRFPGLLTGCRPVRFNEYLIKSGFEIEQLLEVSQNTFPSQIIKARKRG